MYDPMAAAYAADLEDNAYNALYEHPGLIALLPSVAGQRVLEVGCGSGSVRSPRGSVDTGADLVAFDVRTRLLGIARRRDLSSFVVADLPAPLDFLAGSLFDIVVAGPP